ncbi:hypothetical protein ES332_A09G165200v1 [Gossypium tomentosum]|uniref:Uncharacterized protein n=1 Tax=Gossypium tomentosum TaxID=34277 RepID=A0A5D2P5X2_GOSTO|nr:hypothetical protein ES332_A09G165200v1 [Gossypium tomentosum]
MASRLFATAAAEKIEPAALRRQALSLTQSAAPRIRHLLQQLNRLFLDWKGKFDEFVEDKGVKIPIDPEALCMSEFVFINPNSKGQCGYGKSIVTTAVNDSRELLKFPLTDCTSMASA